MKVLVACEFSGVVREAFAKRGHESWSCDLLPADDGSLFHFKASVMDVLGFGWDLMIAHPPCTYLCNSGVRWLKANQSRQRLRDLAVEFVKDLWAAPIERVCIENPIGTLSTRWMKPSQIIQPFHHGHKDWKSTCLWLRGLPKLKPTKMVKPEEKLCGGKKPGRVTSRLHRLPPSKDRWKLRSITYQGIADAMAEQWGSE